jgi:hypothetical protein
MTVLVQKQTAKKFGPFWINLPKVRPQNFPDPTHFVSATFVFCGQKFGLLATLTQILSS